jgi:peptidoglycan/LPS O-acetylase OafA/YrhL
MAAVASASLVFLALFVTNTWFRSFLTNRFLVFTGMISYGLYLLHKIPDDALKRLHIKDAHPNVAFWVVVGVSYLLAIVSWNLLEKPFLNLKRFFETKTNARLESRVPSPEANDPGTS